MEGFYVQRKSWRNILKNRDVVHMSGDIDALVHLSFPLAHFMLYIQTSITQSDSRKFVCTNRTSTACCNYNELSRSFRLFPLFALDILLTSYCNGTCMSFTVFTFLPVFLTFAPPKYHWRVNWSKCTSGTSKLITW
jgi:hypothetical protein